jgi:3-hydroxybutyryl-CoA dehydrogenase
MSTRLRRCTPSCWIPTISKRSAATAPGSITPKQPRSCCARRPNRITVKSGPGFLVNRILLPMINEAFFVLAEGDASATEIDEGMTLGCNHPMGPLALADLIGLDVLLAVMQTIHDEFGDPKYRPCPLLREMVAAGYLGRKTRRGVYRY